MGLDVYAGTLTRYYSRNWKNAVQQEAEANGKKYVTVNPGGGDTGPITNPSEIKEIRDSIYEWQDHLAKDVFKACTPPLWDENIECDYFTDRLGFEAMGALTMLAACKHFNTPLPEYVEPGWCAYDEPVVEKGMSEKVPNSLILAADIWLPMKEKPIFSTMTPVGDEMVVSTVAELKQELDDLNSQVWKADLDTILSWRDDKYYNAITSVTVEKRFFGLKSRKHETVKFRTEELAQCAFSIMYQAVLFAEEHKVSIVLDC